MSNKYSERFILEENLKDFVPLTFVKSIFDWTENDLLANFNLGFATEVLIRDLILITFIVYFE